ncbi:MAG: type IV secretory system conjugative DNA transfer family protein [Rhizobiaceae bacterium]
MSPDSLVEQRAGSAAPGAPLGTAQWMTTAEALQKFSFDDKLFHQNADGLWEGCSNGQLWVGETFEGEARPIGYHDDRHVLLVSGTRGGKGTGVIIPNLCLWPGSCIVIDPKGENATVTAQRRGNGSEYAYGLGQTVRVLDPFGEVQLDPSLKARYNPLDAIDPQSELAVDDAARIAAALVVVENRNDPFWELAARNLIKALILHVLTEPDFEGRRNLVSVWRLLRQGDWLTVERARRAKQEKIPSGFTLLWHGMKRNEAYNGLIAGEAEQMLDMHERTRSGILKVATTATEFIDGLPMQRLLETSDFDLADIKTDPKGFSIYLTLPQRFMTTHYRWLRLMIDLAVGEMERIKGRPATGFPTLFLLDEFAGLKRMETIEHAAAQAAGFGAKFCFVLQNLPQLKEVYSDAWETFLGNSGLRIFFQIDDNFTRKYLSEQLGEREVIRQTRSGSQSDSSSVSDTIGESASTTIGTSSSTTRGDTRGVSSSMTDGTNSTRSRSLSEGASEGYGLNFKGMFGFIPRGHSRQGGTNHSESLSRSHGWSRSSSESTSRSRSRSESQSDSKSRTGSTSTSRSQSQSRSTTDGWGETVHKRNLLNPDEIGRFLSRIDDRNHPGYPGVVLALIPGEQALVVRRVNYFQSPGFEGFFDPHPDYPAPPTLAERIARIAEQRKLSELQVVAEAALSRRRPGRYYVAAAIAGLLLSVFVWLLLPGNNTDLNRRFAKLPTPLPLSQMGADVRGCPPSLDADHLPCRLLVATAKGKRTLFFPLNGKKGIDNLGIYELQNGTPIIVDSISDEWSLGTPFGHPRGYLKTDNVKAAVAPFSQQNSKSILPAALRTGTSRQRSLAFSPDNRLLVSGNSDHSVQIWDMSTLQMKSTLTGHNDQVNTVAISADGEKLASGSGTDYLLNLGDGPKKVPDRKAQIWELKTGDLLKTITDYPRAVRSVAFSPDGHTLGTANATKVKFVNASSGQIFAEVSVKESFLAFAPDLRTLASVIDGREGVSSDQPGFKTDIAIWDAATRKIMSRLTGHTEMVRAVAFSPDGHTLVSAANDGKIIIWDTRTAEIIRTIVASAGNRDLVDRLTVSPNRRTIAALHGYDIKLWDAESGQLLWSPLGKEKYWSIAFSSDGTIFAGGGEDVIHIWNVSKIVE